MTSPFGGSYGDPGVDTGANLSRTGTVNLNANTGPYQQQMGQAAQATNQVSGAVGNLLGKVDDLFKLGGRTLKIVSAADVASIGGAVANVGQLQAQMATLKATSAITNSSYAAFGRTVDDVFSKFPGARGPVVALVNEITNLGVKGKGIENVATSMTKLGAASGENIPELTGDLLQLGRSMSGDAARNIAGYANAVLTLAKNAGTSVTGILGFAQAIAPIGRLAGLSERAVLGISTAFSKAGADGYYAANTFNSIVNDITVMTRTGSPELAKYANFVGMTAGQFKKLPAKEKITEIFAAIAKGGPQALNFMNQLGLGTRGLVAVQAVAQQGGLGHFINIAERQAGGTRNLNRGASAALGGLDSTLSLLHNQVTRFVDIFGAPLLGAATGVAHGLEMFLAVVNRVVGALGPVPAIIASAIAPLTLVAGVSLTHAGLIGAVGAVRLMRTPMIGRAYGEGRITQGLSGGAMTAEEAMAATTTGAAIAGGGRVPWRVSTGFYAGRGRGYLAGRFPGAFGTPVTTEEELAASGAIGAGASRLGGRAIGAAFRVPTWFVRAQASTQRDVRQPAYGRAPAEGTAIAEGDAAATKAVTSAKVQETSAVGATIRGTWNLTRAFADLAVQTAKTGIYLSRLGATGAAKAAGGGMMGWIGRSGGSAETEVAASARAQEASLKGLREAEMAQAATATASADATAAAARMEAEAVAASTVSQEQSLSRLGRMRLMSGGLGGRLGPAMGYAFAGQLAGQLVGGNAQAGSVRSTAGSVIGSAGIGAGIGTLIEPGLGTAVGAVAGGIYGYLRRPQPAAPVMAQPSAAAFRRVAAGAGDQEAGQALISRYLARSGGWQAFKDVGISRKEVLTELTKGTSEGRQNLYNQAFSSDKLDKASANLEKLVATYQSGTLGGLRAYVKRTDAMAAVGPANAAIAGSPLFQQAAYGSLSGSLGAQQRAVEGAAKSAVDFAGNSTRATTELQKLAEAAGFGGQALLDAAAKWQRMIQGFNLPYTSRTQQLGTLGRNVVASRRVALANPANQADQDIYGGDLQAFAQAKQSYNQYLISTYQQVQAFHVQMTRADQDYHLQLFRSERDFEIQMTQAEQDYLRQRSRSIQDFNIQMARQAQSAAESIYDPYHAVQVQQVVNGGMLVANLEDQNRRIATQRRQLEQLRHEGLSQGAIDTLRLSDPSNAQQVNSIARSVVNDPTTIRRINQLIAARQSSTTRLVQSQFNEDFRNTVQDFQRGLSRAAQDYQTAHDRAVEAQRISLSDMSTDYNTMVSRAGQDLTTAMTELYGSFARNYTRTLFAINKDIGKAVPQLAHKLEREITNAETGIAGAAGAGVNAGGGGGGGPGMARLGSAANPVMRPGVTGVDPAGQIGFYTAGGKFVLEPNQVFQQLTPAQQRAIRRRHIAPRGSEDANTPAGAKVYARSRLKAYGWGEGQMTPLLSLWNEESGWSYTAKNAHSGALGIPQALGHNLPAGFAGSGRVQVDWGLHYISSRYGTPAAAWHFEKSRSPTKHTDWYAEGGVFRGPQTIGVGERGSEVVLPLDVRGANFMGAFYDRVTEALVRRMPMSNRGLPGTGAGGGSTYIHEDYRTSYSGDLKVGANNPLEMERKLAARQRLKRLASPARAHG